MKGLILWDVAKKYRKELKGNLKITARRKVKGGDKLLIAEASVGELYFKPVNTQFCIIVILQSPKQIISKRKKFK